MLIKILLLIKFYQLNRFEEDIFIASNNMNKALHGDTVELYIYKRKKNGKQEGEITQIIKRARTLHI